VTAQPITPAPRLIGGVPWRGGPQIDEWAEQQYRAEQADDIYDLYGEDEL